MKQEILYWSEDGEVSLEKTLSVWIDNGNTIVCVVPTEYLNSITFAMITKAMIIYTKPDFGKA